MAEHKKFVARKSLGQNFLQDENVVRKIIRAIDPKPGELIIEVGPGFGVLTAPLLESGCRYVGVEVDDRLIPGLRKRFGQHDNFTLFHQDFRRFDVRSVITHSGEKVRLVGNIPYHITSSIIFTAFDFFMHLRDMTLMVQREVAERIAAAPGSKTYGILSVISQTYAVPQVLFHVPPTVFVPRPDVESSIVSWDFQAPRPKPPQDAALYARLVRTVFNQRRKKLRNTLKGLADTESIAAKTGIDLSRRPESLTVEEFIVLADTILSMPDNRK